MLIDGSWVLPEIRASGIDYRVTLIPPLPEAANTSRPLTTVQVVYASPASAYPDETLALLEYIAAEKSVVAMQDALGMTPVRRDVLRSASFRDDREVRAWHDQASAGVPLPNVPELGYVWVPWGQALDEAIPGLTPAQDALDRAVEQIVGYLQEEQETE